MGGEGGGDRFAVAQFEEAGANGVLGAGFGVIGDGERRGQGVGETVVAVDAGDLFNEVDFTLEVEAPRGELDGVDVETVQEHLAAKGGEILLDDVAGDAFGTDRGSEVAFDLVEVEFDGWSLGGVEVDVEVDDVDEFAFELAAGFEDELTDQCVSDGNGVEVGSALEAVTGVGVEEMPPRGAADGGGIKPCSFDEDVLGVRGDHGVPASHDSGERNGFLFVGDDEIVGLEAEFGSVEKLEPLAFASEAHDDA